MAHNVVVLGAGGWGIALAMVLNDNNENVTIWSKIESEVNEIIINRCRPAVLNGVIIPSSINATTDINVCSDADYIVVATAARYVQSTIVAIKNIVKQNTIIISVAKGLDPNSNRRLSQIISDVLPYNHIVILSGPSHAEEVSRRIPTTLVSASEDLQSAEKVAQLVSNEYIRSYLASDVVGVELGGVIKNVIAVASGIVDGMGYGDNTKAAMMTRSIVEMSRLGIKLGGKAQTFAGLTGIGDLIVTCTSMHSRNRMCGILIGQGMHVQDAIKKIGMTVEGVASAKTVYELAKENNVDMPIVSATYSILYENMSADKALLELMTRSTKKEHEDVWF